MDHFLFSSTILFIFACCWDLLRRRLFRTRYSGNKRPLIYIYACCLLPQLKQTIVQENNWCCGYPGYINIPNYWLFCPQAQTPCNYYKQYYKILIYWDKGSGNQMRIHSQVPTALVIQHEHQQTARKVIHHLIMHSDCFLPITYYLLICCCYMHLIQ